MSSENLAAREGAGKNAEKAIMSMEPEGGMAGAGGAMTNEDMNKKADGLARIQKKMTGDCPPGEACPPPLPTEEEVFRFLLS